MLPKMVIKKARKPIFTWNGRGDFQIRQHRHYHYQKQEIRSRSKERRPQSVWCHAPHQTIVETDIEEETIPLGLFELIEAEDQRPMWNDALDELRSIPTVNMGTDVYHNTAVRDDMPLIPTGQLYVVFKSDVILSRREALLNSLFS